MKRTYKTDRELKALKPADRWYDVSDSKARGLIVRVGPLNSQGAFRRSFCLLARFPGSANSVRHSFGEYGQDLTLEEARELAAGWRSQIRSGIDPRAEARRAAEEADKRRDLAFGTVIEDYLRRHVRGQRRAVKVEQEIRKDVIPHWRDRQIDEITRSDVVALVEAIVDRGAPHQARNVLGHIRTFFNWCIDRGLLETSPCDRLKPGRIVGEKKPRQRVLTDTEIAAFWQATERLGYPYGPLFRLLLVTGQRKSEVGGARWPEFDLAAKLWTVPPERFKSGSSHRVPLSDDAMAIIDTLPRFSGRSAGDLLFSTAFGRVPVNSFSRAKERLDAEMFSILREANPEAILPDFVLHDLRRTVRTRLSSVKVPFETAEMIIGHGRRGLARVYDQHEYLDEMRSGLDQWARRLRSIVSPPPANVVTLREQA